MRELDASILLKELNPSVEVNASTVVRRDISGDIKTRMVRQNHPSQDNISGGLVYRVNNTTDNFLRVCNDKTAIRAWLGVADLDHNHDTKYLSLANGGKVSGAINAEFISVNKGIDMSTSNMTANGVIAKMAVTCDGIIFAGGDFRSNGNLILQDKIEIGHDIVFANDSVKIEAKGMNGFYILGSSIQPRHTNMNLGATSRGWKTIYAGNSTPTPGVSIEEKKSNFTKQTTAINGYIHQWELFTAPLNTSSANTDVVIQYGGSSGVSYFNTDTELPFAIVSAFYTDGAFESVPISSTIIEGDWNRTQFKIRYNRRDGTTRPAKLKVHWFAIGY